MRFTAALVLALMAALATAEPHDSPLTPLPVDGSSQHGQFEDKQGEELLYLLSQPSRPALHESAHTDSREGQPTRKRHQFRRDS